MSHEPGPFLVKGWESDDSGHVTVIGRAGERPIRVDDKFDRLCRYERRRYPEGMNDESVLLEEKAVSLRVVCIHAYGRSLGVLGEGMTGSLTFEGDGRGQVAPGWVLCHQVEHAPERGGDYALARRGSLT